MASLLSTPEPTRRYVEKREQIVAAASEILNAKGVRGATLADVAASVGLTTPSVTYYFKKKEDLAAACFLRSIAAIKALALEAVKAPTASLRIEAVVSAHINLRDRIRTGELPPLAGFGDIRTLRPPVSRPVFAAYDDMVRAVRDLFTLPECAWMTREEQTARAHLLLEALFWSGTWIRLYDREDYARVSARMADVLTNGIALQPISPQPSLALVPGGDGAEAAGEVFLIAATRAVNEHGYSGASVERISAELKVSKGSFYHHNDNRDELVSACFRRTFRIVRDLQHQACQAPGCFAERLMGLLHSLVAFQFSASGPLLRTSALAALPPELRTEMIEHTARLSRRFAAMIADGIADGSCRAVDPLIGAHVLMAMVFSAMRLPRWLPSVTADEGGTTYAQPALVGLLARRRA